MNNCIAEAFQAKPLEQLIEQAKAELIRKKYSSGTISHYNTVWNRLTEYAANQSKAKFYSEELGSRFLRDVYGFEPEKSIGDNPTQYRHTRRAMRILGDMQLHGIIIRHIMDDSVPWPAQFETDFSKYIENMKSRYYSNATVDAKKPLLKRFACYLDEMRVQNVSQITIVHLTNFIATLIGYNPKTLESHIANLRCFMRYLFQEGRTGADLSLLLPRVRQYRDDRIPSVWSQGEVERMLASIERNTKKGKRDYAVAMLAARLGLRASDIKNLKLSDFNWEAEELSIIQSKTKHAVALPLDQETGWALIDYLQHARPITEYDNIFVQLRAPYEPHAAKTTFWDILTYYQAKAGIKLPKDHKRGIHSLRHSLASALLEMNTSLYDISGILGHSDYKSTTVYLKTGIAGLRQCALDAEELVYG
jgi:site-specific recombinase XerD